MLLSTDNINYDSRANKHLTKESSKIDETVADIDKLNDEDELSVFSMKIDEFSATQSSHSTDLSDDENQSPIQANNQMSSDDKKSQFLVEEEEHYPLAHDDNSDNGSGADFFILADSKDEEDSVESNCDELICPDESNKYKIGFADDDEVPLEKHTLLTPRDIPQQNPKTEVESLAPVQQNCQEISNANKSESNTILKSSEAIPDELSKSISVRKLLPASLFQKKEVKAYDHTSFTDKDESCFDIPDADVRYYSTEEIVRILNCQTDIDVDNSVDQKSIQASFRKEREGETGSENTRVHAAHQPARNQKPTSGIMLHKEIQSAKKRKNYIIEDSVLSTDFKVSNSFHSKNVRDDNDISILSGGAKSTKDKKSYFLNDMQHTEVVKAQRSAAHKKHAAVGIKSLDNADEEEFTRPQGHSESESEKLKLSSLTKQDRIMVEAQRLRELGKVAAQKAHDEEVRIQEIKRAEERARKEMIASTKCKVFDAIIQICRRKTRSIVRKRHCLNQFMRRCSAAVMSLVEGQGDQLYINAEEYVGVLFSYCIESISTTEYLRGLLLARSTDGGARIGDMHAHGDTEQIAEILKEDMESLPLMKHEDRSLPELTMIKRADLPYGVPLIAKKYPTVDYSPNITCESTGLSIDKYEFNSQTDCFPSLDDNESHSTLMETSVIIDNDSCPPVTKLAMSCEIEPSSTTEMDRKGDFENNHKNSQVHLAWKSDKVHADGDYESASNTLNSANLSFESYYSRGATSFTGNYTESERNPVSGHDNIENCDKSQDRVHDRNQNHREPHIEDIFLINEKGRLIGPQNYEGPGEIEWDDYYDDDGSSCYDDNYFNEELQDASASLVSNITFETGFVNAESMIFQDDFGLMFDAAEKERSVYLSELDVRQSGILIDGESNTLAGPDAFDCLNDELSRRKSVELDTIFCSNMLTSCREEDIAHRQRNCLQRKALRNVEIVDQASDSKKIIQRIKGNSKRKIYFEKNKWVPSSACRKHKLNYNGEAENIPAELSFDRNYIDSDSHYLLDSREESCENDCLPQMPVWDKMDL